MATGPDLGVNNILQIKGHKGMDVTEYMTRQHNMDIGVRTKIDHIVNYWLKQQSGGVKYHYPLYHKP